MSFQIHVCQEKDLILCHGTGEITPQEIFEALRDTPSQPGFLPGMDRLTVLNPTASLCRIDNDHLKNIKQIVCRIEAKRANRLGTAVRFRKTFVCPNFMNEMMVRLYASVWESDPASNAEFEIFPSISEALRWLGKPEMLFSSQPRSISEPLKSAL